MSFVTILLLRVAQGDEQTMHFIMWGQTEAYTQKRATHIRHRITLAATNKIQPKLKQELLSWI